MTPEWLVKNSAMINPDMCNPNGVNTQWVYSELAPLRDQIEA